MSESHRSLGDFQTPSELANLVWSTVDLTGVTHIVEPTVGHGVFIATAPTRAAQIPWRAFDINEDYVRKARHAAQSRSVQACITHRSAFGLRPPDFPEVTSKSIVLVIGNPPWVTNAGQGSDEAANLPSKSNRFGLSGLAAMTGKSNFDIAEAVLLALLDALREASEVRVALLLKRSVAFKVAQDVMSGRNASDLAFSQIDARRWFSAAVDAGLFQMNLRKGVGSGISATMDVRDEIGEETTGRAGMIGGQFVQRMDDYERVQHIEAVHKDEGLPWRQGLKHDASRVLEIRVTADGLSNGLGEAVEVEADVLCPLYKSSDLANGRAASRLFPLYQFDLKGPVSDFRERWPKLAIYLDEHRALLDARKSRIYFGRPAFMLYGVGPYTSAPYKVAVSGLYKTPRFAVLSPSLSGAPPLVDDTCNLLAFDSLIEAQEMASYLNGPEVAAFLEAVVDRKAKRPYTVDVLRRIRNPVSEPSTQATLDLAFLTA